ncbi:MAG: hypothetical protein J6F30_08860 [Cellulosilyticum sp.]|nr:hypothetical protein [Cellulosilyticum sp.]
MRRDLITRTISGTKATVKVINPATDKVSTREIQLLKVLEGAKLEKAVKKELTSDECFVAITASEKVDKLYGITPSDFMAHAIELDPATRDVLETEASDDAE